MSPLDSIVKMFQDVSGFFYDAYLEVLGWVWPFWLLSYPLYDLSYASMWIATYMSLFSTLWEWAKWEIRTILNWEEIKSSIRSWLWGIEEVLDWWGSWWEWVAQEIDDWWSSVRYTVQGWIDAAVEGLEGAWQAWLDFRDDLWPAFVATFNDLKAAWDNFWTVILPDLVDFTWLTTWWNGKLLEINALIDSWVLSLAPFWEGWQDIRDSVLEFFTDPLEWLWVRFTDWFLGPET